MNNKEYNDRRNNRLKQQYRLTLGVMQFVNYPLLNLLWIVFAVGVLLTSIVAEKLISNMTVYPIFESLFFVCMKLIIVVFAIICAIGLIQFIGYSFAIKDEADMDIVFNDAHDVNSQPPILIRKKKNKRTGTIQREFYTTIPMARWQEKKESICDRMNIHLIGDITYGGKKKNKGNHIYFESAKGRKPEERGVLYDDTL